MTGDWNPTEYHKRSRDPGQSRQFMKTIEESVAAEMLAPGLTKDEQHGIRLQGHIRQIIAAFMTAGLMPPERQSNTIVTSLAGVLGLVLADAVHSPEDTERIVSTISQRLRAIIDEEVRSRKLVS